MQGHDNVVDGRIFDFPRSVFVERGVWVLYKEKNYKGDICVVMEGDKTNFEQPDNAEEDTFMFYDFKNSVSSLKPIVDEDFTAEPQCTVHKHYFDDESLEVTEDVPDLGSMKGKVSSITVQSGAWVGYDDINYGGKQTLFMQGQHKYEKMSPGYGEFTNDSLSSLRALQIKSKKTIKQPKITLYEHANFMGRSKTFTEGHHDMEDAGFFDCASSVIVEGGVWVLYQLRWYRGHICVVMEGDKTNLVPGKRDKDTKFHCFNDTVSSLKPLEFDFTQEPKCTVYEHDFGGRSLQFTEDILDLRWYKMDNTVSSIRVHSGAWVGFEDVDFKGKMTLYLPGDHNSKSTDGVYRNDTLTSLRALQIKPSVPLIVKKIEFHPKKEIPAGKRIGLLSWTQSNNTDVTQKLSVTKETSIKTEDTYEFRWEKETKILGEYSFETLIPFVGFSYKYNMEMVYNIGSSERKKTANTETWSVNYPSDIPSKSKITLTSTLKKGKVDVPFTAHVHQGDKKWTEKGTFKGVQYYDLETEFKEERL
ncbi:unnamed protein product [Mytilus coruscus]|uniref:Beta/gamma crystallin 'Greek key' domain-containing protein n=1 Tax=Mytilus coruscus TaxID=42192 RepID=A0A6J8F181_MYTCO|nr:unnamed protein product [Mytilus coruscus]